MTTTSPRAPCAAHAGGVPCAWTWTAPQLTMMGMAAQPEEVGGPTPPRTWGSTYGPTPRRTTANSAVVETTTTSPRTPCAALAVGEHSRRCRRRRRYRRWPRSRRPRQPRAIAWPAPPPTEMGTAACSTPPNTVVRNNPRAAATTTTISPQTPCAARVGGVPTAPTRTATPPIVASPLYRLITTGTGTAASRRTGTPPSAAQIMMTMTSPRAPCAACVVGERGRRHSPLRRPRRRRCRPPPRQRSLLRHHRCRPLRRRRRCRPARSTRSCLPRRSLWC